MQLIKYKNALNFKTIKFMAESIEVSFSFNILDTKTVPLGWGKLLERSKSRKPTLMALFFYVSIGYALMKRIYELIL